MVLIKCYFSAKNQRYSSINIFIIRVSTRQMPVSWSLVLQMNVGEIFQGWLRLIKEDTSK